MSAAMGLPRYDHVLAGVAKEGEVHALRGVGDHLVGLRQRSFLPGSEVHAVGAVLKSVACRRLADSEAGRPYLKGLFPGDFDFCHTYSFLSFVSYSLKR